MESVYFLGIDISKKNFQAALTTNGTDMHEVDVENNPVAIQAYFKDLKSKFAMSAQQLIVCMEHTGIYCLPLLDYLVKNDIKTCLEPAIQIKKSQGMTRGKSDQIDARRIAQYAYKNRQELRFWKPQRGSVQKLKALLVVRERLVKVRVQLQTPLAEAQHYIGESLRKSMVKTCRATIAALTKDIARTEKDIHILVKNDQQMTEQFQLATSVPGIGKMTALNMMVVTGEFQNISDPKKFACYAGVAPFEHTSGTSVRGKTRVSKMANMTLKTLLHMAAMSSIQCSHELRAYYLRKVSEGKNKMSVINAVRNKLITRVFSCVRNKRMYQKDYNYTLA